MAPEEQNGAHIAATPGHDEVEAELRSILASEYFGGSKSLQDFLTYSVREQLAGRGHALREHAVAVSVFGRREDFDGRDDTIVRVQAHRLRAKLRDYYNGSGADNPIRISLPKGSYAPKFHRISETETTSGLASVAAAAPRATDESTMARPRTRAAIAGLAVFAAGIALGVGLSLNQSTDVSGGLTAPSIPAGVRELWGPFLGPRDTHLTLIYRPDLFLSNSAVLLRYSGPYEAPTDTPVADETSYLSPFVDAQALRELGPFVFNYSWGPVGMASEVHHLTKLFAASGREISLRPNRRFDPNDAGYSNLVVLGDRVMEELWNRPPFTFEPPPSDKTARDVSMRRMPHRRIHNHSPAPGEPEYFTVEHSDETSAREVDYGLFAFVPGPTPGSRIAVCAGITTFAEWGVTQYVTSETGANELIERLGSPLPEFFYAVVRATIDRDTISSVELVAARAVAR